MKKLSLGHFPTPIESLSGSFAGRRLYLKRDDLSGVECAGNKIRKLESAPPDAQEIGADTILTCGGIQSNHARATAAACAKLGMRCILLLKEEAITGAPDGNHLLDVLFGAEIRFVSPEDYDYNLKSVADTIITDLAAENRRGYFMPVGASNGIGTFGYYEAFEEITQWEREHDTLIDTVVVTVGSCGTFAGLHFANEDQSLGKKVIGIPIMKDAAYFTEVLEGLKTEFYALRSEKPPHHSAPLFLDGYAGRGYALNTAEEMAFIRAFARRHGVILDPVYTGKAMRGLVESLEQGHPLFADSQNILFVHTGGLYGLFPKRALFDL